MSKPDTGVLLATDLDFRCDRATDRALRLARHFGGSAVAATVVEAAKVRAQNVPRHEIPSWYRESSPLAQARKALAREFEGEPVRWDVRVGEGNAGDHVVATLQGLADDTLVVTGPVRSGVIGPAALGSTVDKLLRRKETGVLMVRRRVHGDYRHALLATDFSEPSRLALQRLRALFPEVRVTALHGFSVPMLGLMDSAQPAALAQAAARAREEGHGFLRDAGLDSEVELVVEHGDPARLAQQYVDSHGADLVVLGTHGRGAVYELVVGSVARRILTTVDADTLVVRG